MSGYISKKDQEKILGMIRDEVATVYGKALYKHANWKWTGLADYREAQRHWREEDEQRDL